MNVLALVMVLASAVSHATWNFLAKRTHSGAPFVWLTDVLSVLFYAPLVVDAGNRGLRYFYGDD
jgi:ABC-type phosphate transport system auxiliary subunit